MKSLSLTLLVLAVASAANWAVLVCGSDGYGNYRHQADISHAYQIMKKGGIPDRWDGRSAERIVQIICG